MTRKPRSFWAVVLIASVLGAGGLSSCQAPVGVSAAGQNSVSRAVAVPAAKRVVGYFVEWGIYAAHNNYYVTNIPFDKLTHINYAFVGLNPSTFAVEIYDPWATTDIVYPGEPWDTTFKGNLGQLRKAKLTHPNLKVLISVGGWTKSHGFHAAAATASSRSQAAANLVAFMKTHGLDGVDIDWEYPGVNRPADPNDPYDKGAPGGPEDKVNYTLFMAALRAELDRVGGLDGKHYELTAAVGIGYDKIALTEPGQYIQYLDAVNLMTYDMHGAFETQIGHQAPLYTNPNDTHEAQVKEKYTIDWAVNEFLRLGVPAGKIVLGVPFYSRGWDNVTGGWDADGNGTSDGMFGTGGGTLAGQWGIGGQGPFFTVKALEGTSGWEKYRDPYSLVPWLYNRSLRQLYTYDDETSISTKMDYALSKNLGGAMYWELDGDSWQSGYNLVNIIASKILTPVTPDTQAPSVPAGVAASAVSTSSLTLNWNPSSDNVGVAGYTVSYGSTSRNVTGTSAAITGLTPNTDYTFTVKAYDAAGNNSAASSPLTVRTGTVATDTQAPTAPSGLSAANVANTSLTLTWSASTDNVGVTTYTVTYGTTSQTVSGTSASIIGLTANTSYTFTVKAADAAGNVSAASAPLSVQTTNNPVGPAVGVPGTPNLQQTNWDGGATYGISMNMWWGNNGTTFQLFENGVLVATRTLTDNSPNAQTLTVNFTGKAQGVYSYVGKLTNSFGTTSSSPLTYTVR